MENKLSLIAVAALAANAQPAMAEEAIGHGTADGHVADRQQAEGIDNFWDAPSVREQTARTFLLSGNGELLSVVKFKPPPPPVLPRTFLGADGVSREVPAVYIQTKSAQGEVLDMRLVISTPSAGHAEVLAAELERVARQLRDPQVLTRAKEGLDPGIFLNLRAAVRLG